MVGSINKVTLIGNLGQDPDIIRRAYFSGKLTFIALMAEAAQ